MPPRGHAQLMLMSLEISSHTESKPRHHRLSFVDTRYTSLINSMDTALF